MISEGLQAPFPWFGGKSKVSHLIWERFGDPAYYVEPFAGSLAVLLGRPTPPRIEIVNDLDCFIANFWRAMAADPDGVARWADWPVNEADLAARHRWLVAQSEFQAQMKTDPSYFDAQVAGWWVWGLGCWIGGGWCSGKQSNRMPLLTNRMGVHKKHWQDCLPAIFQRLQARLRQVTVCCGGWERVCRQIRKTDRRITAVFLDPPYAADRVHVYNQESFTVSQEVSVWCRAQTDNTQLRIALAGYKGEHELPGWNEVPWATNGGYGNRGEGRGRENRGLERLWFSPSCLEPPKQQGLFSVAGGR